MVSANFNTRFNQVSGVSSIVGLVVSAIPLLHGVGEHVRGLAPQTLPERLDTLVKLSIIILIIHALFWVGFEKLFGWDYATGPTPKGFRGALMSLSLTLPALTVPLVYQYAAGKAVLRITPSNHFHGAILSVAGGAVAYIVLFGMDRGFLGVRDIILHRFRQRQHPLWAEILATLAYALILIVLIATPYRLLVLPEWSVYADLGWSALAALVTFFGLSAYILLKYPDSLKTSTHWGFLRGVIAGMFTVISVCTALYA